MISIFCIYSCSYLDNDQVLQVPLCAIPAQLELIRQHLVRPLNVGNMNQQLMCPLKAQFRRLIKFADKRRFIDGTVAYVRCDVCFRQDKAVHGMDKSNGDDVFHLLLWPLLFL